MIQVGLLLQDLSLLHHLEEVGGHLLPDLELDLHFLDLRIQLLLRIHALAPLAHDQVSEAGLRTYDVHDSPEEKHRRQERDRARAHDNRRELFEEHYLSEEQEHGGTDRGGHAGEDTRSHLLVGLLDFARAVLVRRVDVALSEMDHVVNSKTCQDDHGDRLADDELVALHHHDRDHAARDDADADDRKERNDDVASDQDQYEEGEDQ